MADKADASAIVDIVPTLPHNATLPVLANGSTTVAPAPQTLTSPPATAPTVAVYHPTGTASNCAPAQPAVSATAAHTNTVLGSRGATHGAAVTATTTVPNPTPAAATQQLVMQPNPALPHALGAAFHGPQQAIHPAAALHANMHPA